MPDLVGLDLPAMLATAGYPDPAAGLFAGMAVLLKKSALSDYSHRLSHDHQRALLAALDTQMISVGLATAEQAIFDLTPPWSCTPDATWS